MVFSYFVVRLVPHVIQPYNNVMPYNFTHALAGLAALKKSSPAVSGLVQANMDAFLIGTMGPDPYFGDAMPKPAFLPCRVDLADRLHKLDMRVVFSAMLPLASKSDALCSYVLGFLCHFLLDTTAHPYIEARFSGKAHTPAEIQIDLMMADLICLPGVPAPPSRFYRTSRLTELNAFHAALAKSLFSLETGNAFQRSYRKWIAVNTLSFDPKNRKLRFFSALERLLRKPGRMIGYLVSRHPDPGDRLNQARAPWSAPWEPERQRTESFPELFDRACSEAPELMDAALLALHTGNADQARAVIGARRMDAKPV
ncbi:MAG: zinc dependent phospholipase C family protein [Eubacteriales bacterium]|nr:zinc dependent phospholipase C family protein [Eubacteriales bacterium]